MGISIPIGGSVDNAAAPPGLSIPLGVGTGTAVTSATDRESRVLRALAAAAALQNSGEALALAKKVKDDASHVATLTVDPAKIAPVLSAMDRSFSEGTGGVTPNATQTAAARAVRADPKLVAVAQAALKGLPSDVTTQSLRWVATIDSALLAPAANASFRRTGLEQVPKATQLGRLAQLEARLAKLEGTAPGAVATITVSFAAATIPVKSTSQASASVVDGSGNPVVTALTWSSLSPAIAKVSADGLVTAIAPGTAQIVASTSGVAGAATVTVVAVPNAVTVNVPPGNIAVNATAAATAAVTDVAGNPVVGLPVTWSSSNTAVATVDASGTVTGVAAGTANITATVGGISGTVTVTVG